jgi:DNA-binding LacI/PurR family transcriptional regulator
LLASEHRPTAIFAANNILAEGVWRAADGLGLRIPDDLSLVGFDDVPWMSLVRPGLTVVASDVVAQGRTAVDVLLTRLGEPEGAVRTVVVPYQLIRRGSAGPPPRG